MARPLALIVDDEPDICELLSITLEGMDIATRTAQDLARAREELASRAFALCLTDMRLPDGDGLDLVEWMQTHAEGVPVAVITAHGNVESAVQALKLGAFDFVSKPVDLPALRRLVNSALRLPRERRPASSASRLLGHSMPMQRLRQMVVKVSRSQAPVHISGESGTGKELVARLIHESGARADKPFVPVNCGAIPGELMESELFGHRRGSFTGAVADKAGLFRTADGGTLFLDEIADLPLHMQVKLLRAIQEKTVRPIGEEREQPVDVRILSATHRDLAELVAAGRFREDLYYRINVIELRVPPLRERGDDVLMLADHILARLAEEMGVPTPELAESARSALLGYHFPGNVRELENVLERALTLSSGGTIEAAEIELRPQPGDPARAGERRDDLGGHLEEVERSAIREALERTRYNKTEAARLLGLTFSQLRHRIRKLGLE
jgi:two-component system response regulator PilR (NtrC family)